MSEEPSAFQRGDWYDLPDYYDTVFDQDTVLEADFLEAAWEKFGGGRRKGADRLRILEPACGSGRVLFELFRRGHEVEGFDANPQMLDAARRKFLSQRVTPTLRLGRMETIPSKARFDLMHCLLSTFKYIASERDAAAHLKQAADLLVQGGLYVLGIHLTDYGRNRPETERWKGSTDAFEVSCETTTFPPDANTRSERLRNRLSVRFGKRKKGQKRLPPERVETQWRCRTYDARQLRKLLSKIPGLRCVACYDFTYQFNSPREFDDSQDDIILILKKG